MLFVDIETYSEADLCSEGVHKYVADPSFEILIVSYAFDTGPVRTFCPVDREEYPQELRDAYNDPLVTLHAHNAVFERLALAKVLGPVPIGRWFCGLVHAGYCGLPLSLKDAAATLGLRQQKDAAGTRCINYFSKPCKPTKANGGRTRNWPSHNPELWETYKSYNRQDVETERAIYYALQAITPPRFEQIAYVVDQEINDRGVLIDVAFARHCEQLAAFYAASVKLDAENRCGLENVGSVVQLKQLCEANGFPVSSLSKSSVSDLLAIPSLPSILRKTLQARQELGKSSVKKYEAAIACAGEDCRARGLFQFYGAARTGRWAGRRLQLQNLPQNHIDDLDGARRAVSAAASVDDFSQFGAPMDTMSQLLRTVLIPSSGKMFAVADYSAIEARVIAWLVGENWRLDVFDGDGKIYEASAALMFKCDKSEITKTDPRRQKGKIAELALGYGGGVGALARMGADKIGLSPLEQTELVTLWRQHSPRVVRFWSQIEERFRLIAQRRLSSTWYRLGLWLQVRPFGKFVQVMLPSGRLLNYYDVREDSRTGALVYTSGPNGETSELYGGKLTENIVQAIARDCLAESLVRLTFRGYEVVAHVHDEVIIEVPEQTAAADLESIAALMGERMPWDVDVPSEKKRRLPLRADGYVCGYYQKQ